MTSKEHASREQRPGGWSRRRAAARSSQAPGILSDLAAIQVGTRPFLPGQRQTALRRVNQIRGNRVATRIVAGSRPPAIMRKGIVGYSGYPMEEIDVNTISIAPDPAGRGGIITFTLGGGRISSEIEQVFVNGTAVDLAAQHKYSGGSDVHVDVPNDDDFLNVREILVYFKRANESAPAGSGSPDGGSGGGAPGDTGTRAVNTAEPQSTTAGDERAAPQNPTGELGDRESPAEGSENETSSVSAMSREDLVQMVKDVRDQRKTDQGTEMFHFVKDSDLNKERRFTKEALAELYQRLYAATDDADVDDVEALYHRMNSGRWSP